MILYADTSAIVGAYMVDEPDHASLRRLLRDGSEAVVTSELARLEFASALRAAERAGRLSKASPVLGRFDHDCQIDGPIALLRLDTERVLPEAHRLLASHPLRTLEGIHLATALTDGSALAAGADVTLVTRDARQAAAARREGVAVL